MNSNDDKALEAYLSIAKSLKIVYSPNQIKGITFRIYIDEDGNENLIFVNRHGKTPLNDTLSNMYYEAFGIAGSKLYKARKLKWEERRKEITPDCTELTVVSFLAIRGWMTGRMKNRLSMKLMSNFIGWLDGDL